MPDREKVIKALECCTSADGCCDCPYGNNRRGTDHCQLNSTRDALILLRDQEPVAHAAWLYKETRTAYDECGVKTWAVKYMCSKCGFMPIAIEAHMSQYSYCPSCGARMDEEIRKVKWADADGT